MRIKEGDIWLRLTGGNLIGSPVLANAVSLKGLTTGAAERRVAEITTGDVLLFGVANIPVQFQWSTTFTERTGTTEFSILSKRVFDAITKSADEIVNNSATLQNDDHLVVAVKANEDMTLRVCLVCKTASATPNLKIAFTVPTGGAIKGKTFVENSATPTDVADLTSTQVLALPGTGRICYILAKYTGGANAGSVQLQWAQNTATVEDTTVEAESYLLAIKD